MLRSLKDFEFENSRVNFNLDIFLRGNLKFLKGKVYDRISQVNLINH